ncbi:hypothetical protein [Alicyclobacillus sp. SO9]|uniref:hypothetical protein n=1 Tax=Alicyclobacillus sp. SO9 TaxID=2665646 RepID=UPI0018E797D8|nr:hypothetical protein [Alicyclobacillus sp. SO9]QQE79549.1 hypothetical protein GI364_03370 [Alicyclobacillus sp. SO9]
MKWSRVMLSILSLPISVVVLSTMHPTIARAATQTVKVDVGTLYKSMTYKSSTTDTYSGSQWGQYSSTYSYDKTGYQGTLHATTVTLVPKNKITNRSTTLAHTIEKGPYYSGTDANFPNSYSETYTDSASGVTKTYSLQRSGSPYKVAGSQSEQTSKSWGATGKIGSIVMGSNGYPVELSKFGYPIIGWMSNSYYDYPGDGGGPYYFRSNPQWVHDYYGPNGSPNYYGKWPDSTQGWTAISETWADFFPQSANNWPNVTTYVYHDGHWRRWWVSDTGIYNAYRKGLNIVYERPNWTWGQKYSSTVSLPNISTQWEVYVTYSGTVNPITHVSASPPVVYTNQTSKVTGTVPGPIGSNQRLLIYDLSSRQNVAYGGWGSGKVTANVRYESGQSHQYEVYVTNSAGHWISGGNRIWVTWIWPKITVTASPTSLLTNQSTTLTASVPSGTLPPTDKLTIWDTTSGGNVIGWSQEGVSSFSGQVTQTTPTRQTYEAFITNRHGNWLSGGTTWNGGGTEATVSWQWPSESISAYPKTLTVDHHATLTASVQSGTLSSGERLEIVDKTTGGHVAYGGWDVTTMTASVAESRPTTQVYEVFIDGSQGHLAGGHATAAVTWNWPSPTVQLSASPTSLPVGAKTRLEAVGVNIPTQAKLIIRNVSSNKTLGTYTAQDFTWSKVLPESDSKRTPQTDRYIAQVVSSSGKVLTQSSTVTVTWTKDTGAATAPLNLVLHATGIPQYIDQGKSYVQKFDVSNDGAVPVDTVLRFQYQGMKSKQVQDGDMKIWKNTPVTATHDYPVVLGAHDATQLTVTVPAGTDYISTSLNAAGLPKWEPDPNYKIFWTAYVNPAHNPVETTYADNVVQISVPTNPAERNAPEPVPYVISNPPGETMFGEKHFYNPNWVYKGGQWHYIGPGPAKWVTGKAKFNPGNP